LAKLHWAFAIYQMQSCTTGDTTTKTDKILTS
jgi:hypothetical protein